MLVSLSCEKCVKNFKKRKKATYQRPWIVHESEGPVAGAVSQNSVSRRSPPGALKQQVSSMTVVFEQLNGKSSGQETDVVAMAEPMTKAASTRATFDNMIDARGEPS